MWMTLYSRHDSLVSSTVAILRLHPWLSAPVFSVFVNRTMSLWFSVGLWTFPSASVRLRPSLWESLALCRSTCFNISVSVHVLERTCRKILPSGKTPSRDFGPKPSISAETAKTLLYGTLK